MSSDSFTVQVGNLTNGAAWIMWTRLEAGRTGPAVSWDRRPRIPIATSQALARARPDLVTFMPVNAAGHVKSWNLDPAGYERAARGFLERVAPATH
jgi:hypothetical protein